MATGLLVKGLALLAFLGVLAGATYGVQQVLGDAASPSGVSIDAARTTLNGTAGHSVTYTVLVQNRGDAPLRAVARISGEGIEGRSDEVIVPRESSVATFVTVPVPAGATPGQVPLALAAEAPGGDVLRERKDHLTLRVLAPSVGFQEGDSAVVQYVGRIADTGRVFNTNDQALLPLAFPRTEEYQPSNGALTVRSVPEPSVVTGFFEGILGMQPGESRTFTFPPEKGYGAASSSDELERDEVVEREFPLEVRTDSVARDTFDDYVKRTRQATTWKEGDVFIFEQGANRWPYRIVTLNDERVDYKLAVNVGDNFTLFPFWPNASRVIAVNDTHATFRTTPTTAEGQTFTMRAYWPSMSAIKSLNETTILVRHSPPIGFKFTLPASQLQPAQDATVTEVTETSIVATTRSDNPLAGQALTFDVTLLEIRR